jgi:adenine deaminase
MLTIRIEVHGRLRNPAWILLRKSVLAVDLSAALAEYRSFDCDRVTALAEDRHQLAC